MDLTTARLQLRMLDPSEAPLVADFVTRNREHLAPWEPTRDEAYFTADHWRAVLQQFALDQTAGTHIRRFLVHEGRVIGVANLNNLVRGVFHSCYLGFSLDHAQQGKGLMREAIGAIVAHAFSKDGLDLHRIEANYQPHNTRSEAVLTNAGFHKQGFAKDYLFINGAWRDHVMTARINPDW
jgi:[ribosomal protein S5]-alanine N-acetyltransferase